MKKLVFLCIASCGLALASCGGMSASDNPDVIVEDVSDKDSIAEPQVIEEESMNIKEEEPRKEDDKLKKVIKKV